MALNTAPRKKGYVFQSQGINATKFLSDCSFKNKTKKREKKTTNTDHSMAETDRTLWPHSFSSRNTHSRVPWATSRQLLRTTKEKTPRNLGNCTTSQFLQFSEEYCSNFNKTETVTANIVLNSNFARLRKELSIY